MLCEVLQQLLTQSWQLHEDEQPHESQRPSPSFPYPPLNFKLCLLLAFLEHYTPLFHARSRLPTLISVQTLTVPAFVPHLLDQRAPHLIAHTLHHTFSQATSRRAAPPRTVQGRAEQQRQNGSQLPLGRSLDEREDEEGEWTAGGCAAVVMRVLDCRHPCLLHQRHYGLKIDLIYLLRHPAVAASVWSDDEWTASSCLPPPSLLPSCASPSVLVSLLSVLSLLQGMNAVHRVPASSAHVQFESEEWQYAFEVEHDMQQVLELTTQPLRREQRSASAYSPPPQLDARSGSDGSSSFSSASHPSPVLLLRRCVRVLSALAFLLTQHFGADGCWQSGGGAAEPSESVGVSFHLPLHRLLARLVVFALHCAPHAWPLLMDAVDAAAQTALRYSSAASPHSHAAAARPPPPPPLPPPPAAAAALSRCVWWRSFLRAPLELSSAVAEMRAHLWTRNGDSIIGQQACYRSPSFALPGLYADLTAMQIAAIHCTLHPQHSASREDDDEHGNDVLLTALHRFHLQAFLSPSSGRSSPPAPQLALSDAAALSLAEDWCRWCISLACDRTLLSSDAACIRSELIHCYDPEVCVWLADGRSKRVDQLLPGDQLLDELGQAINIVPNTLIGTVGFPQPAHGLPSVEPTPGGGPNDLTPNPGHLTKRRIVGAVSGFEPFILSDHHLLTVGTDRSAYDGGVKSSVSRAAVYHFAKDCRWQVGQAPAAMVGQPIPGYRPVNLRQGGVVNIRPYYWGGGTHILPAWGGSANGSYRDPRAGHLPLGGWPTRQAALSAQLADWAAIHQPPGHYRLGEYRVVDIEQMPPNAKLAELQLVKLSVPLVFPVNDYVISRLDLAMQDVGLPTGMVDGVHYAHHAYSRVFHRAAQLERAMQLTGADKPGVYLYHYPAAAAARAVMDERNYRDSSQAVRATILAHQAALQANPNLNVPAPANPYGWTPRANPNPYQAIFPPLPAALAALPNRAARVQCIVDYIVEVTAWVMGMWLADGGADGLSITQSLQTEFGIDDGIPNDHSGVFERCRHWIGLLGLPAVHFQVGAGSLGNGANQLRGSFLYFHQPVVVVVGGINVIGQTSILRQLLIRCGVVVMGQPDSTNKPRFWDDAAPNRMGWQNETVRTRRAFLAGFIDGDGTRVKETDQYSLSQDDVYGELVIWLCTMFRQLGFRTAAIRQDEGKHQLPGIQHHYSHQLLLPIAIWHKRTVGGRWRNLSPHAACFTIKRDDRHGIAIDVVPTSVVTFQVQGGTGAGRFLLADGTIAHNCLAAHPAPSHSLLLTSLPEPLSRPSSLAAVDAELSRLSSFQPPNTTRGGTFTIRPHTWQYFNPFFFRFMPQETATAEDRHRDAGRAQQQQRQTEAAEEDEDEEEGPAEQGQEEEEDEKEAAVREDGERIPEGGVGPTSSSSASPPVASSSVSAPRTPPSLCPPSFDVLLLLLHRPCVYVFLSSVLRCVFSAHALPWPSSAASVFPPTSPLSSPSSCSLDRLLHAAVHLMALQSITAPPSHHVGALGAAAPLARCSSPSCPRRPLRALPPPSLSSTTACLPSSVERLARQCRRAQLPTPPSSDSPYPADATPPSSRPHPPRPSPRLSPPPLSWVSVCACEAARMRRSLRCLCSLLQRLCAADLPQSALPPERRRQMRDVLTLAQHWTQLTAEDNSSQADTGTAQSNTNAAAAAQQRREARTALGDARSLSATDEGEDEEAEEKGHPAAASDGQPLPLSTARYPPPPGAPLPLVLPLSPASSLLHRQSASSSSSSSSSSPSSPSAPFSSTAIPSVSAAAAAAPRVAAKARQAAVLRQFQERQERFRLSHQLPASSPKKAANSQHSSSAATALSHSAAADVEHSRRLLTTVLSKGEGGQHPHPQSQELHEQCKPPSMMAPGAAPSSRVRPPSPAVQPPFRPTASPLPATAVAVASDAAQSSAVSSLPVSLFGVVDDSVCCLCHDGPSVERLLGRVSHLHLHGLLTVQHRQQMAAMAMDGIRRAAATAHTEGKEELQRPLSEGKAEAAALLLHAFPLHPSLTAADISKAGPPSSSLSSASSRPPSTSTSSSSSSSSSSSPSSRVEGRRKRRRASSSGEEGRLEQPRRRHLRGAGGTEDSAEAKEAEQHRRPSAPLPPPPPQQPQPTPPGRSASSAPERKEEDSLRSQVQSTEEEQSALSGAAAVQPPPTARPSPPPSSLSFDLLHHSSPASTASAVHPPLPLPALVVQSCGHLLHFDCYRSYLRTLHPAAAADALSLQAMIPCPACRRMANALIPIPPHSPPQQGTSAATAVADEPHPPMSSLLAALEGSSRMDAASAPSFELLEHALPPPSNLGSSASSASPSFLSEWRSLLRRVQVEHGLSATAWGGEAALSSLLLQSVLAHTALLWELGSRNSAEPGASASSLPPLSPSPLSPFTAKTAEMLRLCRWAEEALAVDEGADGRRRRREELSRLLALLLALPGKEEEAAAASAAPLLSLDLFPLVVRLAPLLFRLPQHSPALPSWPTPPFTHAAALRLHPASPAVASTELVLPLVLLAHVLQTLLVLACPPPASPALDDDSAGSGRTARHAESFSHPSASSPIPFCPALPPHLSFSPPPCPSLSSLSSSALQLLSSACLADVSSLSSLWLFVVSLRLRLLQLPPSYQQHCSAQRERQRRLQQLQHQPAAMQVEAEEERRVGEGVGPGWLSLLTSASFGSRGQLLPALCRMTEAFRSQLLHLLHALDGRGAEKRVSGVASHGGDDVDSGGGLERWQVPALASLEQPAELGLPPALLPLLYAWLRAFAGAEQHADAADPALSAGSPSLCFGPLPSLPCCAVDVRAPLDLCGLPPLFQSLLSHGPVRRCPHCGSSRSSFPSPSSVASLLLCLLCGSVVCANSRMRCHLLHVAVCEGYRGCFLSLKRGDCVLVRLEQQPAGRQPQPGAPSPSSSSSSYPSALSSLSPSPCVSLSLYSFCHWPSLYLDAYGESDLNLVRGRPLFLNQQRKRALLQLITQQKPGWEEHLQQQIQQQRSTTMTHTHTTAQTQPQPPPTLPLPPLHRRTPAAASPRQRAVGG